MTNSEMKIKLHNFIETLKPKQLKSIYKIFQDQIEDYDIWKDKLFLAELQKREEDFLNGKSIRYSIEKIINKASESTAN